MNTQPTTSPNLPALILATLLTCAFATAGCQPCPPQIAITQTHKKPLYVLIVIDQLRTDFLLHHQHLWKHGFHRLLTHGLLFPNGKHDHVPTYTAVGHATLSTGMPPTIHGIIANYWYEPHQHHIYYAVQNGPQALRAPTISDWLHIRTPASQTACLALKDRSAILMCGNHANAVLWFNTQQGRWTSQKPYPPIHEQLPHNTPDQIAQRLPEYWKPLPPSRTISDSTPYEKSPFGDVRFPHPIRALFRQAPRILMVSPAGIAETFRIARWIVQTLQMGKDSIPDFLAISISPTDYVGHYFSIHSREYLDIYLWLDSFLGNWLQFLDSTVGAFNYAVVLTSDHGIANNAHWMQDSLNLPCTVIGDSFLHQIRLQAEALLTKKWGAPPPKTHWIEAHINQQFYFSTEALHRYRLTASQVCTFLREALFAHIPDIQQVWCLPHDYPYAPPWLQRSYVPDRWGNLYYVWKPCTYEYNTTQGCMHGSPYTYDQQVPILLYGFNPEQKGTVLLTVSTRAIMPLILWHMNYTLPPTSYPYDLTLVHYMRGAR